MWKLRRTPALSSSAGVTLIEVLVAVVLLLIGVLAVVRIYPTGLDLIRHSSTRSLALRLAEEQMEQWKNRPSSLPDAIVALDPQGRWNALVNPNAEFKTEEPAWQSPPTGEDVNHNGRLDPGEDLDGDGILDPGKGFEQLESLLFRQIFREQAVIPSGGVYPLAAGLPDPTRPVEVTTRYHRSPRNSPAELSLTDDQHRYAINYASREVWFDNDTAADRAVWIDFTYIDGQTGQRQQVLEEPHTLPRAPVGATAPTRTADLLGYSIPLPAGSTIVPGSETVRRRLMPGSGAPYRFNLRPELGVVEFAPENAGLPVEVSYTALDWRIIQEEKTVQQVGPEWVIYTTLPFILNRQEDPRYGGLDGTGNWPDIQIVDVRNPRAIGFDPAATHYRSGRIVLTGNTYAGQRVRVFYRSRDSWAVQPMKAAMTYVEDWRTAGFDRQNPALTDYSPAQADPWRYRYGLVGGQLYLAFYPSEVGQAVVVDYRYDDNPSDLIPPVSVEGEMHLIPAPADPSAHPLADPVQGMCLVRLHTPMQGGRQFTIDRVRGTSLRARVSWHEKALIKYIDLDTYLTRP